MKRSASDARRPSPKRVLSPTKNNDSGNSSTNARRPSPKRPSVPRCGISAKARATIQAKQDASNSARHKRGRSASPNRPSSTGSNNKDGGAKSFAGGSSGSKANNSNSVSELMDSGGGGMLIGSPAAMHGGGAGSSDFLHVAGLGGGFTNAAPSSTQLGHKRSTFELEYDNLRQCDRLEDPDILGPKGFNQLTRELGFKEGSRESFIIAYRLGCAQYGFVTRSEWLHVARGESHLGTLAATAKLWVVDSAEPIVFREIYLAAFDMVRSNTSPALKLDTAVRLWQLLLTPAVFPLVQAWCVWALQEYRRSVTRDLWSAVWTFALSTQTVPLDDYDANGVNPCALDDFVSWAKRRAQVAKAKAEAAAAAAAAALAPSPTRL